MFLNDIKLTALHHNDMIGPYRDNSTVLQGNANTHSYLTFLAIWWCETVIILLKEAKIRCKALS